MAIKIPTLTELTDEALIVSAVEDCLRNPVGKVYDIDFSNKKGHKSVLVISNGSLDYKLCGTLFKADHVSGYTTLTWVLPSDLLRYCKSRRKSDPGFRVFSATCEAA